jgi:hypothetical protein
METAKQKLIVDTEKIKRKNKAHHCRESLHHKGKLKITKKQYNGNGNH